jgi:glycosyltransferase involved in cell wall biosynthesis
MARWRIAFIVPRYGEDILGGAETLARRLAEEVVCNDLAEVQVFTTCARNHLTWRNELPEGAALVGGVPVHRFPLDHLRRNEKSYHTLHARLIGHERLSLEEQLEWVANSAHSPALYSHLKACGRTYDFLIFIPYLFGTTLCGAAIHPDRSVLWPCLHDEVYAYLEPTHNLFKTCQGIMFNTYPEQQLARRLYGRHPGACVVGFGMESFSASAQQFRQRHNVHGPFVLYSGRLEGAKNLPLLIEHFLAYKRQRHNDLKLVLMGSGPESIPRDPSIVQVGFLQGQEKLDAYAAATLLCQPSVNESFSIVIMESWLCKVPVIVHADCAVTRYHVMRSNGGLYFRDYDEFEAVLDLMLQSDELRKQMGQNGHDYVRNTYAWDRVLERFEAALTQWQNSSTTRQPIARGYGVNFV